MTSRNLIKKQCYKLSLDGEMGLDYNINLQEKQQLAVSRLSRQLELITEVDLHAVPHQLLTNQGLVLKTPILDTEDEWVQVCCTVG